MFIDLMGITVPSQAPSPELPTPIMSQAGTVPYNNLPLVRIPGLLLLL